MNVFENEKIILIIRGKSQRKKGKQRERENEREPDKREEEKSRILSETYLCVNGKIKKEIKVIFIDA